MQGIETLVRTRLERRLADPSLSADDRRAVNSGLLPLFDDLALRYYLRCDGSVVATDALDPEAGLQELTDERDRLRVYRALAEDDPVFEVLVPPRPSGRADCETCRGSGRSTVTTVLGRKASTTCGSCLGTGWIRAAG